MTQINHTPEFIQKRKLAMILPVFVSAVACFMFWVFDGGTKLEKKEEIPSNLINSNLLSDKVIDTDVEPSLKEKFNNKNQFKLPTLAPSNLSSAKKNEEENKEEKIGTSLLSELPDFKEHKINELPLALEEKNNSIKKEKLSKEDDFDKELKDFYKKYENKNGLTLQDNETKGLENQTNEESQAKSDNETPTKKTPVKIKPHFNKGISSLADHLPNSMDSSERFYQLGNPTVDTSSNMIKVVVHQNQKLGSEGKIKLRLLSDVNVNGKIIPKGTFLFGLLSIKGNRVGVDISSVFHKDTIFPFEVELYDKDGLKGIDVPGILAQGSREVAASMIDSIQMQNLQFYNGTQQSGFGGFQVLQPDFEKQLIYDGVKSALEATKSFIKSKLINNEVYIKANHILYLKQKNNNNEK